MLSINVSSAGFERLLKDRIRRMPQIGRAAVDQVTQMHRAQVQKNFKGYSGDPNTGNKLQNRSGALMQRLAVRPSGMYPSDVRADSYVAGPLAYAKIQEFGGVIKPKTKQFLTIPLPGARTSNGVTRNSARLVKRGSEFHTAGTVPGAVGTKTHIRGKAIGVDGPGGDFLPLYALKKSVRIKPRLRFMDTFKAQKAKRRTVYRRVVKAFVEWEAALVATFSVDPEQVDPIHSRNVLASSAASGAVFTRQANTAVSADSSEAEVQSWDLSWEYASAADWATIEGYWNTTYGGALSMTWTPPGGSALTVRMTRWTAESNAETNGYRMRVVLEEIL